MKNKPYNYNAKSRTIKKGNVKTSKDNKKKEKSKKEKNITLLENTIKIDTERLKDANTLDTSFLEGRIEKKVNKNQKLKNKILVDNSALVQKFMKIRKVLLIVLCIIVGIIILFLLFFKVWPILEKSINEEVSKARVEHAPDKTINMDYNYLFIGDHYTKNFIFSDFGFDYHYVNGGDEDLTTSMLLDSIKEKVYIYNPSVVFIQVGYNDLNDGVELDTIIDNLKRIIKGIKNNRPYASIYIESIYPINLDFDSIDTNVSYSDITSLNKRIFSLTKELDINYLDMYQMLIKDNKLDTNYTEDGFNLNKDGYKQVLKLIKKVID